MLAKIWRTIVAKAKAAGTLLGTSTGRKATAKAGKAAGKAAAKTTGGCWPVIRMLPPFTIHINPPTMAASPPMRIRAEDAISPPSYVFPTST